MDMDRTCKVKQKDGGNGVMGFLGEYIIRT